MEVWQAILESPAAQLTSYKRISAHWNKLLHCPQCSASTTLELTDESTLYHHVSL